MAEVVCPDCGARGTFKQDDLTLYSQVECEVCGSILEVVEDDPIIVEVVGESDYVDDDELDEDDEDS